MTAFDGGFEATLFWVVSIVLVLIITGATVYLFIEELKRK